MRKIVAYILIFTLFLSGCASYRAGRLPTKDIYTYDNRQEKEGLFIAVKFFTPSEIRQIFQRNIYEKNIEPVYIVIDNRTKNTYQFRKSMVSKNSFSPDEVANMCAFGTVKRAAGYGILGILIWPFLIPAIVDGIGSSQSNARMRDDYNDKEIKDERIYPSGLLSGVLFLGKMQEGEELSIRLQNIETNESVLFSFKR